MQTNREALLGLGEPEYCDKCSGLIYRINPLELALDWVAYWLVIYWPVRWLMTWPCRALLPRAGNIAFSCSCWPKIREASVTRAALKARAQKEPDHG